MIIQTKTSAEIAPYYFLDRTGESENGTTDTADFEGVEVETTTNGDAHWVYAISEREIQDIVVTNESGDTDITDYPQLRPAEGFTGIDQVMLTRGVFKRPVTLDFTVRPGSETKRVSGLSAGDSYMRYSFEWLGAILAGEGSMAVYSGSNRNTGCWAASEDMTGIPYSNSNLGNRKNGALITRRHMVGVRHYPLVVGNTITFKNAANVDFTYTVVGVSEAGGITEDAIVYTLNDIVDASIKSYPLAGRWLLVTDDSGPSFQTIRQMISMFINQDRVASFQRISFYDYVSAPKVSGTIGAVVVTDAITEIGFNALFESQVLPELAPYSSYHIGARKGDSGSAILVPVAGGLAVCSTFTGIANGPFFDEDFTNALIASADADAGVSTGYTVTVATDPTA